MTATVETEYLDLALAAHEYERCHKHLIDGEYYWMHENRRGIGKITVRIERERTRSKPWDLWAVAPGWRVTVESVIYNGGEILGPVTDPETQFQIARLLKSPRE